MGLLRWAFAGTTKLPFGTGSAPRNWNWYRHFGRADLTAHRLVLVWAATGQLYCPYILGGTFAERTLVFFALFNCFTIPRFDHCPLMASFCFERWLADANGSPLQLGALCSAVCLQLGLNRL
jgi:hypothetical protein